MYLDTYIIRIAIRVFHHFLIITSFNTAFLVHVGLYEEDRISKSLNDLAKSVLSFEEATGIIVVQKVVGCACLDMYVN